MGRCLMGELRCLLLLCCCLGGFALDGPEIDMWVEETSVAVGDRVTVHLRYRWPLGWEPSTEPRPGTVFNQEGAFLVDLPAPQKLRDGEAEQRRFKLGVIAGRSGPWLLPQPGIQVSDPQGGVHTATAPAVVIEVGIDGEPVELPEPSPLWMAADDPEAQHTPLWPWLVLLAAAALLTTVLLLRRGEAEEQLSAADRFRQDLRLVRAASDGKHASSLLSQALRRYVGRGGAFDGLGATTRELRALLADHYQPAQRQELLGILEELDAQRWAPLDLQAERIAPLLERAAAWVDDREAEAAEQELDDDGDEAGRHS